MATIAAHRISPRDWGREHKTMLVVVLAVTVIAAMLTVWLWRRGAERRALERMPENERAALFWQTRDAMRGLCEGARTKPELRARCNESAEFVLMFPECDAECRAYAQQFTWNPAR